MNNLKRESTNVWLNFNYFFLKNLTCLNSVISKVTKLIL